MLVGIGKKKSVINEGEKNRWLGMLVGRREGAFKGHLLLVESMNGEFLDGGEEVELG